MPESRQERANRQFSELNFIIFDELDTAILQDYNLEFGIDSKAWTIGPKFRGVKLVPSGFHIITLQLIPSKEGRSQATPMSSFVMYFPKNESNVICFHFDPVTEDWKLPEDEMRRCLFLKEQAVAFDSFLAPYSTEFDPESYQRWLYGSKHVSQFTLKRIFGDTSLSSTSVILHKFTSMTSSRYSEEPVAIEPTWQVDRFYFPELSFAKYLKFKSPRNSCFQDKSAALEHFLATKYLSDFEEFLGDMQLSWLIIVNSQNLEGLDHWKTLLSIVSQCSSYLVQHADSYHQLLSVLNGQLQQIPRELGDYLFDPKGNVIAEAMCNLFWVCKDMGDCSMSLKILAKNTFDYVEKELGWDIRQEEYLEEEQPVIVNFNAL